MAALVVTVGMLVFPGVLRAADAVELDPPQPVPSDLPSQQARQLNEQREKLAGRCGQLNQLIEYVNRKARTGMPPGEVPEFERKKAELKNQMADYFAAVARYDARLGYVKDWLFVSRLANHPIYSEMLVAGFPPEPFQDYRGKELEKIRKLERTLEEHPRLFGESVRRDALERIRAATQVVEAIIQETQRLRDAAELLREPMREFEGWRRRSETLREQLARCPASPTDEELAACRERLDAKGEQVMYNNLPRMEALFLRVTTHNQETDNWSKRLKRTEWDTLKPLLTDLEGVMQMASKLPTWSVRSIRGTASRGPVENPPPLRPVDIVLADRVRTGPNSHVVLRLAEEAVLALGPDTDIQIDEPVYDKMTDTLTFILEVEVKEGILRFCGKLDRRRFQVRTSHSVDAVKGTDIIIKVSEDAGTTYSVLEGAVEFTPRGNPDQVITVGEGEEATVSADGQAGPVTRVNRREVEKQWEQAVGLTTAQLLELLPGGSTVRGWMKYVIAAVCVAMLAVVAALLVYRWAKPRGEPA